MQLQNVFQNHDVDFEPGRRKADPGLPRMIMVHGAGGNARAYLGQLGGIRNADPCSVSLPGHGTTPGPGMTSITEYSAWLSGLIQEYGKKVVLLGHSMGGAIAMQCALNLPGLVQGLVLVGTGARLRVFPAILDGILQDFEKTVHAIIRAAYDEKANPQWLATGAEEMASVGPEVLFGDFTACDKFDITASLKNIACPAKLVYGDSDKLTPPKYGGFLAGHLPNASLDVIAGCGHMVHVENAAETNRAIDEFFLGLGGR